MEERTLIVALTTLNLAVGISAAMILSRLFCPRRARTRLWVLAFLACLGMYFLECVAFTVGMATQVFVLSLAVVWGALVGWWSGHVERTQPLWPMAVAVGFYTSFPTLSFSILVPIACVQASRGIVSPQAGLQFGIPDFLPVPFQTILGFCVLLGLGTLFLKCGITTAVALAVSRHRDKGAANQAMHATLSRRA